MGMTLGPPRLGRPKVQRCGNLIWLARCRRANTQSMAGPALAACCIGFSH
jgi:hypothetical protein